MRLWGRLDVASAAMKLGTADGAAVIRKGG